MKKVFELLGTYRDCRKVQETRLNTGMHNRVITVLHEQGCVLESRDTPTAGNNLIPITVMYSPSPQASNQLAVQSKNVHSLPTNIAKGQIWGSICYQQISC